jgi:hypothetical protein
MASWASWADGDLVLNLRTWWYLAPNSLVDKVAHLRQGLAGQVDGVGTHVGDLTFLVQALGAAHGRLGAEAEAGVGFLLEGRWW